eukprot:15454748-Alexandrium_andersonii.AAC.1
MLWARGPRSRKCPNSARGRFCGPNLGTADDRGALPTYPPRVSCSGAQHALRDPSAANPSTATKKTSFPPTREA